MKHQLIFVALLLSIVLAPSAGAQMMQVPDSSAASEKVTVGYDQIRPVLRKRCVNCHNPEELRGELDVSSRSAILAGSASGPVVVSGKANQSLLYTTVAHLEDPTMPPNSKKISGREIELIRRWIGDGLVEKSGELPAKVEQPKNKSVGHPSSGFCPVSPVFSNAAITTLAAHPGGKLVAVPGNKQIVLLAPENAAFEHAMPFPQSNVTALAVSQDGKLLVAAGGTPGLEGMVIGYEMDTGEVAFQVGDERDSILACTVSPDNQYVAVGGPSRVLRVYEIASGKVRFAIAKHTDWVLDAKYSPDGLLLASSDRFGAVFVWEAQSGELFHVLRGHVGPVHSLAWDQESETLVTAGEDGTVRCWNMHHGEQTAKWDPGVGPVLAVGVANGVTIVAGRDQRVTSWLGPNQQLGMFEGQDQFEALAILSNESEDARCIVSDARGQLSILRISDLALLAKVELPIEPAGYDKLMAQLDVQSRNFEQQQSERDQLAAEQSVAEAIAFDEDAIEDANTPTSLAWLDSELDTARQLAEISRRSLDHLMVQREAIEEQITQQKTTLDLAQRHFESLTKIRNRFGSSENDVAELAARLRAQETLLAKVKEVKELTHSLTGEWKSSDDLELLKMTEKLQKQISLQLMKTRQALSTIQNPNVLVKADELAEGKK